MPLLERYSGPEGFNAMKIARRQEKEKRERKRACS
jgi:hypothetical protein